MDLRTRDANWQNCVHQTNPEGCVLSLIDSEGNYLYVNQGWQNLLAGESPIGKHYSEMLPNKEIGEVLRTGRPQYGYWHYNDKDSDSKGFFAAYIPIYEDGKIQRVAIFSVPGVAILPHDQNMRATLKTRYSVDSIIGVSETIDELRRKIKRISPAHAAVVIEGETGTGKELIAQALHSESGREGPFVSVNCASIPESLFEAEFFGYVDGAFTGALRGGRAGLLETAHGGTLFLDEIHHLSLAFQAKLLRALQEKQVMRIGGVEPIAINARVVCATNQSMKKLVEEGAFREDLYFRLSVLLIHAPALRERSEDIPLLTRSFIQQYSTSYGIVPPKLDDSAQKILKEYDWPGNVRELQNVIERAIIYYGDVEDVLTADHLGIDLNNPLRKRNRNERVPLGKREPDCMTMADFRESLAPEERSLLVRMLEECGGNKSLMAKKLGISRTQLYNKLKEHKIEI